jgi:tRNA threonylcarbamoyladenosine biosynthesis protein TsaE
MSWKEIENGIVLRGDNETHIAGKWIGTATEPNRTITISGNLGDGKTSLCKGIAEGWGVAGMVKSPTYNYFLTYQGVRGLLLHLDAYRLSNREEYESLLLDDLLEEPWLLLVEWPQKVSPCLPSPALHLRMSAKGEDARLLKMILTPDDDPFAIEEDV